MAEECTHDCSTCSANCSSKPQGIPKEELNVLSSVKHVIAVVSGKGGVGKSIVTSMLAVLMQRKGYKIAVISWLSMGASEDYNERVTKAKLEWLARHLPSVEWDRISIVEYGTPKEDYCETELDILFDDDDRVRENWSGVAYDEENILEILKNLLTN